MDEDGASIVTEQRVELLEFASAWFDPVFERADAEFTRTGLVPALRARLNAQGRPTVDTAAVNGNGDTALYAFVACLFAVSDPGERAALAREAVPLLLGPDLAAASAGSLRCRVDHPRAGWVWAPPGHTVWDLAVALALPEDVLAAVRPVGARHRPGSVLFKRNGYAAPWVPLRRES